MNSPQLKDRIFRPFLLIAVVPLVVLAILASSFGYNELRNLTFQLEISTTRQITAEVESFVSELELKLSFLDQQQDLAGITDEQKSLVLSRLLSASEDLQSLTFVDVAGNNRVYVDKTFAVPVESMLGDSVLNSLLQQAIQSRQLRASDFYFDEQTGKPGVLLVYPLFDTRNDSYAGAVLASIKADALWEMLQIIDLPASVDVYILNQQRQLIAHRDATLVLRGSSLQSEVSSGFARGLHDDFVIMASSKVSLAQKSLVVVTEQPVLVAMAPAIQLILGILILLAVSIYLSAYLARRTASFVSEPIHRISEAAKQIGDGNTSIRTGVRGADEVGTLGQTFDQMAETIENLMASTRKAHQELEKIAHYDALTGLPNRLLLADRLNQAMKFAERSGSKLAVAFLDLDGFKVVNDTHGHHIGDEVLVQVTNRIKKVLRESDSIARLGGDEFVVVFPELAEDDSLSVVMTRILRAVQSEFVIEDRILHISTSIGITFFPQQVPVEADQLLRQADQAMYQAKVSGKNRYVHFDLQKDEYVRDYHAGLKRIEQAILENQLSLYYQPKVNLRTGEVIGVEALVRWDHPEQGILTPGHFLPTIESHALIVDLGQWVLETCLEQVSRWASDGINLPVSINVSARELQDESLIPRLKNTLQRHPEFDPGKLTLEILETSALEDMRLVTNVISECKNLGVKIALDDFGTGYSSLTYLKRIPTDEVKVDQSFVRDIVTDPEDFALLQGINALVNTFQLDAIAEGVETVEHGKLLLNLGFLYGQGYAIARPMDNEAFRQWLSEWQPVPEWKNQPILSPDYLNMVSANVTHRAWLGKVTHYLKRESVLHAIADGDDCGFGYWYEQQDKENNTNLELLLAIEAAHSEIHELANRMMAEQNQYVVDMQLREIHAASTQLDEMIEQYIQMSYSDDS